MPKDPSIKKVLVIGSGPIIIGQAAEFDYSGTQACRALKSEGIEVVLVNSNPATIMTDPDIADRVYVEPMTLTVLRRIIEKEKPDSILPNLGGQTGLNLAMELARSGYLEQAGVRLLGAKPDTIDRAEDRQLFKDTMEKLHQPIIPSKVVEDLDDALDFAEVIGYPVIVRPRDSIQSYPINGEYEILAGHNRVRSARDLGWETIKASIVRVDDVQAVRIINDSNLQRTGVTELEKAWAYRQLFDAMQRQGQRTDLMAMLEGQNTMEGDDGLGAMVAQSSNGSKRTSDTIGEVCGLPDTVSESSKRETVDTIGEMYGQSGRTVRRKIRLTYLIDELYRLYERKDISQGAAVDLSYLDTDTQRLLLQLRRTYRFPLADGSCHALRVDYNEWNRSGSEAEYAPQRLLRIMQAPAAETEAAAPVPMKPRKYTVPETLFPITVKKRDREAYVEKALRYVLEHDIEL